MIMRPSVHDPVSHTGKSRGADVFLERIDEHFGGRRGIGGADRPILDDLSSGVGDDNPGISSPTRSIRPAAIRSSLASPAEFRSKT